MQWLLFADGRKPPLGGCQIEARVGQRKHPLHDTCEPLNLLTSEIAAELVPRIPRRNEVPNASGVPQRCVNSLTPGGSSPADLVERFSRKFHEDVAIRLILVVPRPGKQKGDEIVCGGWLGPQRYVGRKGPESPLQSADVPSGFADQCPGPFLR